MLELKLITEAPKAGMWSHIRGWSHLAVQRVNQLVNSGSEWTIKTLEATERNKFPWAIFLTTMKGNVHSLLLEFTHLRFNMNSEMQL